MDDWRITERVARYDEGVNLTVPTAAFPVAEDPRCYGEQIDGTTAYPTPVDQDIMIYDEECEGWRFEQRGVRVHFQLAEPTAVDNDLILGDFWSTTVATT